jgi:hypothetical protein
MQYTGVLIEVSDAEVHLKGSFQWITLPISSVSNITLKKIEEISPGQNAEGE